MQETEGRIVGGGPAERGQYPFIVSLQWVVLTLVSAVCGGSIVSPHVVLTAAHCETELPNVGSKFAVGGLVHLNETGESQRIPIDFFYHHPNYTGGVDSDDISLVIKLFIQ